ncbi:MAG TPA: hypothetical protein VLB09_02675 [Nitrospiria bacterium]|nr:hypothetical protein [Nitrospiria bacterium]
MTSRQGLRIVLAPFPPSAHVICCCCGARYRVQRTGLHLFGRKTFYGEICPDCVLRGPKAAADSLKALAAGKGRPEVRRRLSAGRTTMKSWRRLLAEKLAALESMEAFALDARRAAVRETREKR